MYVAFEVMALTYSLPTSLSNSMIYRAYICLKPLRDSFHILHPSLPEGVGLYMSFVCFYYEGGADDYGSPWPHVFLRGIRGRYEGPGGL